MKVRNRPVIGSWWSSYYIAIKVTPQPKNRPVGHECSLTGFRGLRGFGDSGEYGSGRDKDHEREHDGFRGFLGHSDLFDDFLLIKAFLCQLLDLIQYHLAFY
jgi:hypothetical protein